MIRSIKRPISRALEFQTSPTSRRGLHLGHERVHNRRHVINLFPISAACVFRLSSIHRRLDQGGACIAAWRDPGSSAFRASQSVDPLAVASLAGPGASHALAGRCSRIAGSSSLPAASSTCTSSWKRVNARASGISLLLIATTGNGSRKMASLRTSSRATLGKRKTKSPRLSAADRQAAHARHSFGQASCVATSTPIASLSRAATSAADSLRWARREKGSTFSPSSSIRPSAVSRRVSICRSAIRSSGDSRPGVTPGSRRYSAPSGASRGGWERKKIPSGRRRNFASSSSCRSVGCRSPFSQARTRSSFTLSRTATRSVG